MCHKLFSYILLSLRWAVCSHSFSTKSRIFLVSRFLCMREAHWHRWWGLEISLFMLYFAKNNNLNEYGMKSNDIKLLFLHVNEVIKRNQITSNSDVHPRKHDWANGTLQKEKVRHFQEFMVLLFNTEEPETKWDTKHIFCHVTDTSIEILIQLKLHEMGNSIGYILPRK